MQNREKKGEGGVHACVEGGRRKLTGNKYIDASSEGRKGLFAMPTHTRSQVEEKESFKEEEQKRKAAWGTCSHCRGTCAMEKGVGRLT